MSRLEWLRRCFAVQPKLSMDVMRGSAPKSFIACYKTIMLSLAMLCCTARALIAFCDTEPNTFGPERTWTSSYWSAFGAACGNEHRRAWDRFEKFVLLPDISWANFSCRRYKALATRKRHVPIEGLKAGCHRVRFSLNNLQTCHVCINWGAA